MVQSTFNFDYKNPERGHSRSLQRKTVHPHISVEEHDFRVCPKYLNVTSDFEEMTSVDSLRRLEAQHGPSSPRRDCSSGRKSPPVKGYCDTKYDFIASYNDLMMKNKVLRREVSHLKKNIFSTQSMQSEEEDPQVAGPKEGVEEVCLSLAIKPETTPRLDIKQEIKQLSPIDSLHKSKCIEQTPERMQSEVLKSAQTTSMQFNLSNSGSKNPPVQDLDTCGHAAIIERNSKELKSLQEQLASRKQEHESELSKEREARSAEVRSLQSQLHLCEGKRKEAEEKLRQAAEQLTAVQNESDRSRRAQSESESRWAFEKSGLNKEKDRLIKDVEDLRSELNKLKYEGSGSKMPDGQINADLLSKCGLLENEVVRLRGLEHAAAFKDSEIDRLSAQLKELERLHLQLKNDHSALIQKAAKELEEESKPLREQIRELEEANRLLKHSQPGLHSTKYESQHNATPEKLASSAAGNPVSQTDHSSKVREIEGKLRALETERDALLKENEELKHNLGLVDSYFDKGEKRLRRAPKSFHILAPVAPQKESEDFKKKASTKSVNEYSKADFNAARQEPSLLGDELQKKDAHELISQKIKGTGLGLSIVRRAVEAHHGTISVDSTLGVETVFTIRLPDFVPMEKTAPVPAAE